MADEKNSVEEQLPIDAPIPAQAQEKMEKMRKTLDQFKDKALARFEGYIMGIALAPPEQEGERKDKINVLVLIDDEDSKKMTKDELHDKLTKAIQAIATEVDKNIAIDIVLLTEFWQACYDGKQELLQVIALSAPIYDAGMLGAIKIAEIHKGMVLKKFEKYIACYVLAGSLVRGQATPQSDIDVFVVIDDTDVKKMSRVELKDKLRAIIHDMSLQAGQMTGIQNKLSIQTYILTDFWDNMKEANPIIFTFLRDGVPFYDRGVFMPWKQLLKMGRIKPSQEAIETYRSYGDQIVDRIQLKLRDIAVEDFWYATITPSQAAIMLYGLAPPAPRETPGVMREIFVKKEKLFEEKHVKFLEKVIKTHKDVEYGNLKNISGSQIEEMLESTKAYLKALNDLYEKIEARKEEESVQHLYENIVTVVRDVLKLEGVEKVADKDIIAKFEKDVVHKGVVPERYTRVLKDVFKAKKDYDEGKLKKSEVAEVHKEGRDLIKFLIEHIQRQRAQEFDRARLRVKHGQKYGEVLVMEDEALITIDLEAEEKQFLAAKVTKDGSLGKTKELTLEQFEQALAKERTPKRLFLTEKLMESLKEAFGADVEIMVN